MKTSRIYLAGIVSGILIAAIMGLFIKGFEAKFWLGARNGFLVGMGIVFTSTVLNYFAELLDFSAQAFRKDK